MVNYKSISRMYTITLLMNLIKLIKRLHNFQWLIIMIIFSYLRWQFHSVSRCRYLGLDDLITNQIFRVGLKKIIKNCYNIPVKAVHKGCTDETKYYKIGKDLRDSCPKPSSDLLVSLCPNYSEHLSRASHQSSEIFRNAKQ